MIPGFSRGKLSTIESYWLSIPGKLNPWHATSLASVAKSILKGLEYSGNFSTGAQANSYFKVSKAHCYLVAYFNSFWLDSKLLIEAEN